MTQLSQERTSAAAAGGPNGGWVPPPAERPSRTRRLLAASVLLALLVGVPTALAVSVGTPLPESLPALSDVAGGLSSPLAPSLIVEVLALVAWAAWAHFAVCLTVELWVAVRAGHAARVRPAPRVPLGGLSQQLARRLVEAALVTATVASSVGAGAGSGTILTPARPAVAAQEWRAPVPTASTDQHEPAGSRSAATDPATGAVTERQAARPNPEYVVQPPHGGYYDSLWDIAERFLGDGQRWREIYELNKSRGQPDGRALSRPELIRPGWMLYLPADATGLSAVGAEGEAPAHPAPPQAAGSPPTTSGVSPSASPPPVQAAPPAGPQDMASPVPTTAPWAGAGPAATGTVGPSPSATLYAKDPGGDSDEDEDDHNGSLQGQTLGGLLAAAVLAALATLRHRQRRRRPDNGSIPIPQPAVARAEGQLRVLAEPDDLEFVDETLRALTLSLQGREVPDVRSALLRPGHLDLRLVQARPDATPPFTVADGGRAWRVSTQERPLIPHGSSGEVLPLLPLLLTVGRDPDGPVLLDLEATGSLALQGAEADVLDLLTHLVAESVLAPWADAVEVLIAGFGPDVSRSLQLLAPDRVTAVNEIDRSLLRVLEMRSSRVSASGERLSSRVRGSSADAKDEVRPPLLVVHAAQLTPLQAEQLAGLVPEAGRGGVAVVAPAPWQGAREMWTLGQPLPLLLDAPAPTPCRLDLDRL